MARDENKQRLMDQLGPDPSLGPLQAMLATTFNLQAPFVDGDLLPSVLGARARLNSKRRDRIALERQLAELSAAVILMDARPFEARPTSLRVELHARMSASLQHSKVTVLVYEGGVRLVVGSANLTEPGYRRNREVVSVLSVHAKNTHHAAVVHDALAHAASTLAPWWTDSAERVVELARQRLDEIVPTPQPCPDLRFVWSGPGRPLLEQLLEAWPGGAIRRITVVSPFWSDDGRPLPQLVDALNKYLTDDARIELLAEQLVLPTGEIVPVVPAGLLALKLPVSAHVWSVDPKVDAAEAGGRQDIALQRKLHAKIILIEGDAGQLVYAGSANFTASAWGLGHLANAEAGLLARADKGLRALLPPRFGAPIPLGQASPADHGGRDPAQDKAVPWPSFLLEVRLGVDEDGLFLMARYNKEKATGAWHLSSNEGAVLLRHPQTLVRLQDASDLLVDGEIMVSWWASDSPRSFPLNVDEALRFKLPMTADGAPPGEAELLAYYLGRIDYEDTFGDKKYKTDADSDDDEKPDTVLAGVDTSSIQSYQVRSFVEALPGIAGDLQRSVDRPAAYRLALTGPVSPLALAQAVISQHQAGTRTTVAAFFELEELRRAVADARLLKPPEKHTSSWLETLQTATTGIDACIAQLGPASDAIELLQRTLRSL